MNKNFIINRNIWVIEIVMNINFYNVIFLLNDISVMVCVCERERERNRERERGKEEIERNFFLLV